MTRNTSRTLKRFDSERTAGEARPTSAKVLSALFNILNASGHTSDAHFLDLFAGSGGVALRAIDHGASCVLAVESDRTRASAVNKLFTEKHSDTTAKCLCMDVRRALPKIERDMCEHGSEQRKFDIIFSDPPYENGWGEIMPELIKKHISLLAPDGVFIMERSIREEPCDIGINRDDRRYGDTVLSFYWLAER